MKSDDDRLRCRAIWVLGWLGTWNDIDLLSDNLFYDPNNENRGWAAAAFMQIFNSNQATGEKSLHYLKQALTKETDSSTLEIILINIQEITGKKLGIHSGSHGGVPK